MEHTDHVAGVIECQTELLLRIHSVHVDEALPGLRLAVLDEADQRVREQAPFRVVHIRVARIAARGRPEERGTHGTCLQERSQGYPGCGNPCMARSGRYTCGNEERGRERFGGGSLRGLSDSDRR